MEINELRQLSNELRGALHSKHGLSLKHGQALDFIAALPGLRNWSEVLAMPEMVASVALDLRAAQRLSRRIKQRCDLEIAASWLLTQFILVPVARPGTPASSVWPEGPEPGVYISTSQELTESFMEAYQHATEGMPAYAVEKHVKWPHGMRFEPLESLKDSKIGELPRGTLVVAGPVSLCQGGWAHLALELRLACKAAIARGLRIVLHTYADDPKSALHDVRVAAGLRKRLPHTHLIRGELAGGVNVRTEHSRGTTAETAPIVEERRTEFFGSAPQLKAALNELSSGFLLLAYGDDAQRDAAVRDISAMTKATGPAAVAADLLMTRHPVVGIDPTQMLHQLPLCSSASVAFENGFKRVFIDLPCDSFSLVLANSKRLLVIGCIAAHTVDEAMSAIADCSETSPELLNEQLRAVISPDLSLLAPRDAVELQAFAHGSAALAEHRRFIHRLHETVEELPAPNWRDAVGSAPRKTYGVEQVSTFMGQISMNMTHYYARRTNSAGDGTR